MTPLSSGSGDDTFIKTCDTFPINRSCLRVKVSLSALRCWGHHWNYLSSLCTGGEMWPLFHGSCANSTRLRTIRAKFHSFENPCALPKAGPGAWKMENKILKFLKSRKWSGAKPMLGNHWQSSSLFVIRSHPRDGDSNTKVRDRDLIGRFLETIVFIRYLC